MWSLDPFSGEALPKEAGSVWMTEQPSLPECLLILRHALCQDGCVMGRGNDSCQFWFDVSAGPLTDSPVLSASLQSCVSCLGKAGLP